MNILKTEKNKIKPLDWSLTAINNRIAIFDYIAREQFNPINAAIVEGRIVEAAEKLKRFPLLGIAYKNGQRLAHIPKTQYTIVYRVTDTSIRILRVTHQKRKVI